MDDIRMFFKQAEYVLVIVKAEVDLEWPSNKQVESYRFYYPYQ
jgi:hypothetical protein